MFQQELIKQQWGDLTEWLTWLSNNYIKLSVQTSAYFVSALCHRCSTIIVDYLTHN